MVRTTEHAIIQEQAEYIHRNLLPCSLLAMISAVIVAVIFEGTHPAWQYGMFVATVLLLEATNLRRWRYFRHRLHDTDSALHLLKTSTISMAISSTLWGAAICLIIPVDRFPLPLTFFCAILANTAAATFYFGPHYPTFVAAALPMAVIGLSAIAVQGTLYHPAFFGLMSFFPAFMVFAWRFNRLVLTTHQLRFANLDLVTQLTTQKERAENATLAKSRFLAAASHDLRQPMHALNLYLGTLSAHALPEQARRALVNARRCAETMDDMFRALLDISRLDASVTTPALSVFPVAHLLDGIRMEFTPQAEAKGLRLRVCGSTAFIRSDPALLDRILRNLVSNALRYTRQGSVLIGCRREPGCLRIDVLDTGPGIAATEQAAIFDEFYQVDARQRGLGLGLGLGLAIVKRLAALLQARLHLHSVPGRGARFGISVPMVEPTTRSFMEPAAEASDPVPKDADHLLIHASINSPTASPANAPIKLLAGLLVVIIDDEVDVLDAASTVVTDWGCTVVSAASGTQAVERLGAATRVPDAIICDYHLRGDEDGQTAVAMVRKEFNHMIPALLVTGDTGPDQIRALALSGLPVLHKPLQADALRHALVQAVALQHPVSTR